MDFTYPSYNNFKRKLGYIDSINELNEVAIREFSFQANEYGSFEEYLKIKSELHKVKVDFPEIPQQFNSIIAKSYISQVSQCFEEFLVEFQGEHKKVKNVSWTWEEDVPKQETAFKKVKSSYKRDKDINYRICDYYRLVRNSALHSNDDKKRKKLDREYAEISSIDEIQHTYSKLDAPNNFDNTSFDDFILYSRAAKELALLLCELGKPTLDEIVDLANLDNYTKYDNNPKRKVRAIKTELKAVYGIQDEDAEMVMNRIDII